MSYVDYRDDLKMFNALLESADPVVLFENEDLLTDSTATGSTEPSTEESTTSVEGSAENTEPAADSDNDKKGKKGSKKSEDKPDEGSLIVADIRKGLNSTEANADQSIDPSVRRKLLFRLAYNPAEQKPINPETKKPTMNLVSGEKEKSDFTVIDDNSATELYKVDKDGTITVNFSNLIYRNTSPTYKKALPHIQDKDAEAVKTDGGFQDAINKALNELIIVINNNIGNLEDLQKKKDQEKEERKQKRLAKQQDDTDKRGQDVPPDDNGQDPNGDNPNGQDGPDTPDDTDGPETPEEVDQKKLFSEIVKDFKENQTELMASDCDQRKEEIGNNPDARKEAIGEITEQYFTSTMEPYEEKADDDTKDKVRRVIEYNVKQQFGVQTNGDNPDNNDAGTGNDAGNDPKPRKPSKPEEDDEDKKDYSTWWDNTKDAWGLNNNPLYDYKPQGKTLGQLWKDHERKRDAEDKVKRKYEKDMDEYNENLVAWEERQKNRGQTNQQTTKKEKDDFDFMPDED